MCFDSLLSFIYYFYLKNTINKHIIILSITKYKLGFGVSYIPIYQRKVRHFHTECLTRAQILSSSALHRAYSRESIRYLFHDTHYFATSPHIFQKLSIHSSFPIFCSMFVAHVLLSYPSSNFPHTLLKFPYFHPFLFLSVCLFHLLSFFSTSLHIYTLHQRQIQAIPKLHVHAELHFSMLLNTVTHQQAAFFPFHVVHFLPNHLHKCLHQKKTQSFFHFSCHSTSFQNIYVLGGKRATLLHWEPPCTFPQSKNLLPIELQSLQLRWNILFLPVLPERMKYLVSEQKIM